MSSKPRLMWQPSQDRCKGTNLYRFMRAAEARWNLVLPDYDAAYVWSITRPEQFWSSLWDFLGLIGERGNAVIERADSILEARFFPDAKLNFAENLLRLRNAEPALIACREDGDRQVVSREDLYARVSQMSVALADIGIQEGDRVAGVLPNTPEAVVSMLATNAIGGIWSSCAPELGVEGLLDRLGQIGPKVLIGADGYAYNGTYHETRSRISSSRIGLVAWRLSYSLHAMDQRIPRRAAFGLCPSRISWRHTPQVRSHSEEVRSTNPPSWFIHQEPPEGPRQFCTGRGERSFNS